jgi:hypothetical protein
LIFRGLNFSQNADIGQIGHLWMGTIHVLRVRVNSEDESVARGQVAIGRVCRIAGRVDLQFCSSGEGGDSDPGRRVIKSDGAAGSAVACAVSRIAMAREHQSGPQDAIGAWSKNGT